VVSSFGLYGLNYTIIRPFSVYGIRHHNIISIIRDKLLNDEMITVFGDGEQKRSFTHILDICRAVYLMVNNEVCFGEEYNLSGPKEYSVNDLIELLSNKYNKLPKITHKQPQVNELLRNHAETNKIRRIGFKFERTLEDFIFNELE